MTNSEFKVNVTADISALQASLKNVQSELDKFKRSADNAASATKGVEREANRGRLVAFAFGQVLRDAGFFAQDFRLGILAISNNIPILIDQLVLLSGVSQAAGSALSLLGSLLTAGLTIWAYSSDGIKKNRESIDDYIKSLDDLREAQLKGRIDADSEIRSLELLRKAAQDETFSRKERLKAVKELQDRFPDYYGNLSAETIMAGKDANAHRELALAITAVADAKAREELIKENRKVELTDNQKLIDLQAERVRLQNRLNELRAAPTGISGSKTGENQQVLEEIRKINNDLLKNEREIFTIAKERNKARENSKNLEQGILDILKKQKSILPITGDFGEPIEAVSNLESELDKIFSKSKLNLFDTSLIQFLPEDYKQKQLDDLADFYGDIQALIDKNLGPIATGDQITEATDALYVPFDKQKAEENFKKWKENFDAISSIYEEFNQNLDQILLNGTVNILSNGAEAIGEALARGGNVAEAAGKSMWLAFATILQQLGQVAIQTGLTIKAIKSAIENINPFVAIAAGAALIALAGYLRGRISKIGGQMGSGNQTAFANGGIVSGPTSALVGEYPGARSNPEVIAPLDKLQSIIGSSMGGQLPAGSIIAETKISGNDLSILVKRADKNRGEYF